MIDKFYDEKLKVQIMGYCEKWKEIVKIRCVNFMARKSIFYNVSVLKNEKVFNTMWDWNEKDLAEIIKNYVRWNRYN